MNCVVVTLALALVGFAQSGPPPQSSRSQAALPTEVDVQAALSRMLGYDPSLTWQIISVHPSQIPGLADAVVSINKQGISHIYVSADGKFAIIGELIPFGPDPFAEARAQLAGAAGPTLGPAQAAMRIVEFTDLQCQPCIAAQATLEKVATDFPTVQILYEPFPLPEAQHPWALKAAEYADCVNQLDAAAFWRFVDGVLASQGEITPANENEKLAAILTSIGADPAKILACTSTAETTAHIQKSLELAGALNTNSVPTVFINGRRLTSLGSAPYEQVKAIVKFELEHVGK